MLRPAVLLAALALSTASAPAGTRWIAGWASAQQSPVPAQQVPPADLTDATVRQIVRVTLGGSRIRLRLSNAFGAEPLRIASVHVALAAKAGTAAIRPGTDREARFGGAAAVTIPAGAETLSDPIELPVSPLAELAVSLHLPAAPTAQTSHVASHATSFRVAGNHVADAGLTAPTRFEHWLHLAGVEIDGPGNRGAIVAFGDSITDGSHSTTDGYDRWTDRLAERLQASAATRGLAVLNAGIGGNRVLQDGVGPNGLARFDRDVLARPGVRYLILLEGINDLGTLTRDGPVSEAEHGAFVARLLAGYGQIIDRAHAHGIRVIGATLLPFAESLSYRPGPQSEADRQRINAWIRESGRFDGVIDFDRAVRDPARPDRLLPAYDCGDHLHPSPAGYRAMGDAVPLALFRP